MRVTAFVITAGLHSDVEAGFFYRPAFRIRPNIFDFPLVTRYGLLSKPRQQEVSRCTSKPRS